MEIQLTEAENRQEQEEAKATPTSEGKLTKKFHHKKNSDEYEGTLILNEGKLKIEIMKVMEPLYWVGEFTIKSLAAIDKRWMSLLDEDIVFKYALMCFKDNAVTFIETDDTGLKLEFKYQLGCDQILLPIFIKRNQIDVEQVIIKQGSIIKDLMQERNELKNSVNQLKEEMKENVRDIFVLLKENDGSSPTTYSPNFVDIGGIKPGEITIRRKCKVKWSLYLSGLYFNIGNSGYNAFFRLELANADKKIYWPSEKGCVTITLAGTGSACNLPFSFEDVAELDEGKYTVRIQWSYSSNSSSYTMTYYHSYGPMNLIIETY